MKADEKSMNKAKEQEKHAIEQLKKTTLLVDIIEELHKNGVEGEEDTILVLLNRIFLRLVKNTATATSGNIAISDESGLGKDFVAEKICKLTVPEKYYYHRTRLSEKVFTYWHTDKKSQIEGFNWKLYVLHVEDPKEDLLTSDIWKTMASGGSDATIVKDQKVQNLKALGKPVMIITSYRATLDTEGARRWDGVDMDNSEEQTRAIIARNLRNAQYPQKPEENNALIQGFGLLAPKNVVIPYANELNDLFSSDKSNRTISNKFMDFIKASAAIHQYQRETEVIGDEKYIVANWFDYDYALFVFNKCITGNMGFLNKIEQELIYALNKRPNEYATFAEIIESGFTKSKHWLYDHIDDLIDRGLLREAMKYVDSANKEVRCYQSCVSTSLLTEIKNGKNGRNKGNTTLLRVNEVKMGGIDGFTRIVRKLIKMREDNNRSPIKFFHKYVNTVNTSKLDVHPSCTSVLPEGKVIPVKTKVIPKEGGESNE